MDGATPASPPPSAGRRLAWLAAIGTIIGLTALYSALTPRQGVVQVGASSSGASSVVLQRDRSGHFLAAGKINGQAVVFLVDTGATDVAVSDTVARALGLEFGPQMAVMTAAGPSRAWMTRLEKVSVGSLSLSNVRATITPGLGDQVLLGMSFLRHFDMRADGDRLIIERNADGMGGAGQG